VRGLSGWIEGVLEVLTETLWNSGPVLVSLLERSRRKRSPRAEAVPRVYQRQRRLSSDERVEVARRYISGETMGALASSFDCHRDAIRRALKREGVELRNWRAKVADPARVVEPYEAGQTAAQIAVEFGVSATAVLNESAFEVLPMQLVRHDVTTGDRQKRVAFVKPQRSRHF
jgi:hypothetical protein